MLTARPRPASSQVADSDNTARVCAARCDLRDSEDSGLTSFFGIVCSRRVRSPWNPWDINGVANPKRSAPAPTSETCDQDARHENVRKSLNLQHAIERGTCVQPTTLSQA